MAKIGYHASHEQFSPSALLKLVQKAEKAGFQFIFSSDHFHPWNSEQGESGFAWSWLGAAMAVTTLKFGVVNAPGGRYHPAIIAQAAATLEEMFPNRFRIAAGSGQAINEAITGEKWPIKEDRNQRLKESVEVMRALWSGKTVTHKGLIQIEEAKLYSRPKTPPPVFGAAITPVTARWMAGWADGMITISQPKELLKKVVDAWNEGGGENKPMILKVQLSYDKDDESAMLGAHEQWRTNIFESELSAHFRSVAQLEMAAKNVTPEDVAKMVNISSNPERHIEWINSYIELGFNEIDLHNVNLKQEQFIEVFGEKVLPYFRSKVSL
ncbi:MAG: TIGR03885 family FMN-dependent LLM class oxidoreductase [Bacteroidota bacterium]|nr:TIGR03885 family FMN-dependent LLM class oxidoreductase [Bacteroidota bacterium]